jgi:hypothetical protein
MAPGYSTPIWGPPLWRILHTLAHAHIPPRHAEKVVRWIQSLAHALPCSFCRASFARFMDQLRGRGNSMRRAIANGSTEKWMYDVHELVNDKLDLQHAENTLFPLLSPDQRAHVITEKLYRADHISFACLQKRFAVTPVAFSAQDVWDVLSIFTLNYPDTCTPSCPKGFDLVLFVTALPDILTLAKSDPEIIRVLRQHPLEARDVRSNVDMFAWAVRVQYPGRTDYDELVPSVRARYDAAIATTCAHGSCI